MSSLSRKLHAATVAALLAAGCLTAHAGLPEWLQHVIGASSIEAALFRVMPLPSVQALYPRPPKESQGELARLIVSAPDDGQLYTLRAQAGEAALDFAAAEADWKQTVVHSKDPVAAQLQLADFYHRRLQTAQELAVLNEVAAAPAEVSERFVDPAHQRSWLVFDRILALLNDQALPAAETSAAFQQFLIRYPDQPAVYARFLTWQLAQKQWAEAQAILVRYQKSFPQDGTFPIRAQALLEYRRGNVDRALAVYDQAFQSLWPAQLIQSYFGLLEATHRQRAFVAEAHTRLQQHPDDLNALARIFYYDQQAGRLDKARQTLDTFRIGRETRNESWSAGDLATLAALEDSIHAYAESARFNFALASAPGTLGGGEPAAQAGLAALIHLLLSAPDQPIALGAGNLSLYRDIATLDQGPGYWNGILSLWLNGTSPASEYDAGNARAQTYFHRSKAAELLTQLDQKFPAAAERASLHAELIRTYAQYGESDSTITAGQQFLGTFPASSDRVEVAGLMADAFARRHNTAAEFALYDSLLTELAAKTGGLPLTAGVASASSTSVGDLSGGVLINPDAAPASEGTSAPSQAAAAMQSASYELTAPRPAAPILPEAVAYTQTLDRYLGRLVAEQQLPQALIVLRRQLDRNAADPLLYERLATFLAQNSLSQQQEEVYRSAIARFNSPGWYDKLARLYLRERNREAYVALTHQVSDTFAGTELDAWFKSAGSLATFNAPAVPSAGPQLALQLNLYAAHRFPHDPVFIRNLLAAYQAKPTVNPAAYEDLLRHHWWESDELRAEFLTWLARTGKLQAEKVSLATLTSRPQPAGALSPEGNAAATRELAEIDIWSSQFEAAAPLLGSVAALYPADAAIGDASVSLYRSLAYLDPTPASTRRAVAIETNLLAASPSDANRLATLGDLYAEATAPGGEDLRAAAPYWRRIPTLHPGTPAGFLTSATVFWDYFQFDDALAELTSARTRFHQPTLFGFEAGAIAENRRDLPAAIAEYTGVATAPPDTAFFIDSLNGAIDAFSHPPSDAADSNLRATTQSLFNSAAARDRLLQLATRPATRTLVDSATAKALAAAPTPAALILRADILTAQHRQSELPTLLEQALARSRTPDEAAAIGNLARAHSAAALQADTQLREVSVSAGSPATVERRYASSGSYALTSIYEHALERQIALRTDPVQKIELSYTLSASLESHQDVTAAARVIDTVYRANPRILGVVRTTTDFYTRSGQPPRAIATLLAAAKAATPDLARSFTLEAAQEANDAGDTRQARALAEPLLAQTPYDASVLAILSASYARAGDDAGLKNFYLARLASVQGAALSPGERRDDIALLRRGLIPALTRMKDYEGALNQYIALLSAYPEDASTAQQAALFALRYGRQPQLLDFLRTTVRQSPKDSRFAVLLAQVDTTFDDLAGAVTAYSQAIAIRKDRADLYIARSDLELRLSLSQPARLDAAAADFQRLYLLSYKDPSWMVRLGELRARQQRPAEAVAALTSAWITGQPSSAANQFKVADQLLRWNLLDQSRTFAEQGIALAGTSLLTSANGGAATCAHVEARLGRPEQALAMLADNQRKVEADLSLPAGMAAGFASAGVSALDIAAARTTFLQARRQTAHHEFDRAVAVIGQTIQTFYTPEQKLAFAQTLDTLHNSNPTLALAAASAAGLADREAGWRRQMLVSDPINPRNPPDYHAFESLERARLAFPELAQTLEAFAARTPAAGRPGMLAAAARAWRDAGDEGNELRVTRPLVLAHDSSLQNGLQDRLFLLLLRRDRPGLIALAGNKDEHIADAAADYAVAHATQAQALDAVAAHARTIPNPVWRPAMASLVLTSFASPSGSPSPAALASFSQALAFDASIAQRLGKPADPHVQLTGDPWFYYAARFGLFLATVPRASPLPDSEDFLSAELERAPSAVTAYLQLARSYTEAGNLPASIAEYEHALELAPNNPALHDEFAVILFRAQRREDAFTQWHAACALLAKRQSGEQFFASFRSIVDHLRQRALFAAFRPDLESILRPYFARNGNFRSNELLEAIFTASPTPAQGTAIVLSAAAYATDPNLLLDDLHGATWLTPEAHEAILQRQIELARNKPKDDSTSAALTYQNQLLELFLNHNQPASAQSLFDSISSYSASSSSHQEGDTNRIILATRTGHLPPLLDRWRNQPDTIPSPQSFTSALYSLRLATAAYTPNEASIRPLQEFVFAQKQLDHTLQPTDFLALASSRLSTGDLPGALDLLHRLALQPTSAPANDQPTFSHGEAPISSDVGNTESNPCANSDYAAAMLETTGHSTEAIPFLQSLVQAVPWKPEYRLRLAEAQIQSSQPTVSAQRLAGLILDANAPYALRLQAASSFAALGLTDPRLAAAAGSELTLLATGAHPSAEAARHPYFAAARIAAASAPALGRPDHLALLREALAIQPADAAASRARIDLLLAQTPTDSASSTLALVASLNVAPPTVFSGTGSAEASSDDAADAPAELAEDVATPAAEPGPSPVDFPFPLPAGIDRPTQIRLATLLASAWNRDQNSSQSLFYDRLAVRLDAGNPKPDPIVLKRLTDYEAALALEQKNAQRRPHIHAELDQSTQVRPRLTLAGQALAEAP